MEFIPSERKRWNRCERKRKMSEREAQRIAQQIRINPTRNKDLRMIAYKCYYGDHWHIGHARLDSRQWREMKEGVS